MGTAASVGPACAQFHPACQQPQTLAAHNEQGMAGVSTGLRSYLWNKKPYEEKAQREVCWLCGAAALPLISRCATACARAELVSTATSVLSRAVPLQVWMLNGATYEGYRSYIRRVKDQGFPAPSEPVPDGMELARLPTTQSAAEEVGGAQLGGSRRAMMS